MKNTIEFYKLEDRILFEAAAVAEIAEAMENDPNANMSENDRQAQDEKNAVKNAPAENPADVAAAPQGMARPDEVVDIDAEVQKLIEGEIGFSEVAAQAVDAAIQDIYGDFGANAVDEVISEAFDEGEVVDVVVDHQVEATVSTGHELVIINSTVQDAEAIIAELGPDKDVLVLEAGTDAMEQINEYLEQSDKTYDAIHIVAHGDEGHFVLNGELVSENSFNAADWANMGKHLTVDGDIMLYGCNLAASESGQNLVSMIADASGADVAASLDNTGLNGNWTLEYSHGLIETTSISVENYRYTLATYTVTNLNDSGAGSLRQGLTDVNNTDIVFNIAGGGTIQLNSEITLLNTYATNSTLTINGLNSSQGQITIAAATGSRIFNGTFTGRNMTVNISNLKMAGSTTTLNGGVIYMNTNSVLTLGLTNVDITGGRGANGASLYLYGTTSAVTLNMTDSTITNSVATGNGGAIYTQTTTGAQTLNLASSNLTGDKAADGGAIYMMGASSAKYLTLSGTTLVSNNEGTSAIRVASSNFISLAMSNTVAVSNNKGHGFDFTSTGTVGLSFLNTTAITGNTGDGLKITTNGEVSTWNSVINCSNNGGYGFNITSGYTNLGIATAKFENNGNDGIKIVGNNAYNTGSALTYGVNLVFLSAGTHSIKGNGGYGVNLQSTNYDTQFAPEGNLTFDGNTSGGVKIVSGRDIFISTANNGNNLLTVKNHTAAGVLGFDLKATRDIDMMFRRVELFDNNKGGHIKVDAGRNFSYSTVGTTTELSWGNKKQTFQNTDGIAFDVKSTGTTSMTFKYDTDFISNKTGGIVVNSGSTATLTFIENTDFTSNINGAVKVTAASVDFYTLSTDKDAYAKTKVNGSTNAGVYAIDLTATSGAAKVHFQENTTFNNNYGGVRVNAAGAVDYKMRETLTGSFPNLKSIFTNHTMNAVDLTSTTSSVTVNMAGVSTFDKATNGIVINAKTNATLTYVEADPPVGSYWSTGNQSVKTTFTNFTKNAMNVTAETGDIFLNIGGLTKVMDNGDGGFVFKAGRDVEIKLEEKAYFERNTASANGGAISIDAGRNVKLTFGWYYSHAMHFSNNMAAGDGGALYVKAGGDFSMEMEGIHSTLDSINKDTGFQNNTAGGSGGGIYVDAVGTASMKIGADVYKESDGLEIGSEIMIRNNTATTGSGGGIYLNSAGSSLEMGSIGWRTNRFMVFVEDNVAAVDGGGIYVAGTSGNSIIRNVRFNNNEATAGDGGAIYHDDLYMMVSDSRITENTAAGKGGAYYGTADSMALFRKDAVFTNTAGVNGSAIYGGKLHSDNSTYYNNTGGKVIETTGDAALVDLTVTGNSGGVVVGGDALIINTIIAGNTGAQLAVTGTTTQTHSIIQNSAAGIFAPAFDDEWGIWEVDLSGPAYQAGILAGTVGSGVNEFYVIADTTNSNWKDLITGLTYQNSFDADGRLIITSDTVWALSNDQVNNGRAPVDVTIGAYQQDKFICWNGVEDILADGNTFFSDLVSHATALQKGVDYTIDYTNQGNPLATNDLYICGIKAIIDHEVDIHGTMSMFGTLDADGEYSTLRVLNTFLDAQFFTENIVSTNRLLKVTDGDVLMQDLILKGGSYNGNGAIIYVENTVDSLTLDNVLLGEAQAINGGALYNNGIHTIYFNDTSFVSNFSSGTATGQGGAAIYNNDGTIWTTGKTLVNKNKADGDKGAVYNTGGGTIHFGEDATDVARFVANYGSGIYNLGQIDFEAVAEFEMNRSFTNGGAIRNFRDGITVGNIDFYAKTTFLMNEANANGGAIENTGTMLFDAHTTFAGNYATTGSGGAIVTGTGSDMVFTKTTNFSSYLKDLTVITSNKAYNHGGAIAVFGQSSFDFEDSTITFSGNNSGEFGGTERTVHGGGIYVAAGAVANTFNFKGATVSFNSNTALHGSGGGIHVANGTNAFDFSNAITTFNGNRANNGNGGGISAAGGTNTFDFTNGKVVFQSNKATYGSGGGIYMVSSGLIDFRNATKLDFLSNTASPNGHGGGIYSIGVNELYMADNVTNFNGNTAGGSGGGIYTDKALSLINSTFTGNKASGHGGGIYYTTNASISARAWVITGGTFSGNTAGNSTSAGSGGAIYSTVVNTSTLPTWTITGSATFSSNTAYGDGGAIWLNNGTLTIGKSADATDVNTFSGNRAYNYGGSIHIIGTLTTTPTNLYNVVFNGNIANAHGGGIYANVASTFTIVGGSFTGNIARSVTYSGSEGSGSGGAISFSGTGTKTIRGGTAFNNNYGHYNGGAIAIYNSTQTVNIGVVGEADAVTFTGNYTGRTNDGGGGAVVIWEPATVNVNNTTFTNNYTTNAGGSIQVGDSRAILNINSTTTFVNTLTSAQRAYHARFGGVIWNMGTTNITLPTGWEFSNYRASVDGGVIYNATGATKLAISGGMKFTTNRAERNGGAIWDGSGKALTLTSALFTKNEAGTDGGALFLDGTGTNWTILGDTGFVSNTAGNAGGAIQAMYSTLTIGSQSGGNYNTAAGSAYFTTNKTITTANNSGAGGGAIASGGPLTLNGVTFTDNSSRSNGGTLWVGGTTYINHGTKFINNVTNLNASGYHAYEGGLINNTGTMTVNLKVDTAFNNYKTSGAAGAIRNTGTITFKDKTSFTTNTAGTNGGAFASSGTAIFEKDAIFTSNSGTAGGGAVYNSGTLTFKETATFTTNNAANAGKTTGGSGGGLWNNATVVFEKDATFDRNYAYVDGGGIYDGSNNLLSAASTAKLTFTDNEAGDHAGALRTTCAVTMNGWSFTDNKAGTRVATGSGGAIYYFYNGADNRNWTITDTLFENNQTNIGATGTGSAGAIRLNHTGTTLSLLGTTTFKNNSTAYGGGAIYTNGTVNTTNINFTGNTVVNSTTEGGGAIWSSNALNITGGTFDGNKAIKSSGGAIWSTGAVTIKGDAMFKNNEALNQGGAIYHGGTYALTIGNAANPNAGSAVFLGNKSTGTNNSSAGGAIYQTGAGGAVIDRVSFSENNAYMGGGLYTASSNAQVSNSTFHANAATGSFGGGIVNDNSMLVLDGVTLTGNRATTFGGGLYQWNGAAPKTYLLNDLIVGNYHGANPTLDGAADDVYRVAGTIDMVYTIYGVSNTAHTGVGNISGANGNVNISKIFGAEWLNDNGTYKMVKTGTSDSVLVENYVVPILTSGLASRSGTLVGKLGSDYYYLDKTSNLWRSFTATKEDPDFVEDPLNPVPIPLVPADPIPYDPTNADGHYGLGAASFIYNTAQNKTSGSFASRVGQSVYSNGAYVIDSIRELPSVIVTTDEDTIDPYDHLISLREALTVYGGRDHTGTFLNIKTGQIETYVVVGTDVTFEVAIFVKGANNTVYIYKDNETMAIEKQYMGTMSIDGRNFGRAADIITVKHDATLSSGDYRIFTADDATADWDITLKHINYVGGTLDTENGGAILVNGLSSVLLLDTVGISGSTAVYGGGLYVNGTNASSLTVKGASRFTGNTATLEGGGIYAGAKVATTIGDNGADKQVIFTGNRALDGNGGGVYAAGPTLNVFNSTFDSNSASDNGGGIYTTANTVATIGNRLRTDKVSFWSNSALNGGGVFGDGKLVIENSEFRANTSSENGAGVYAMGVVELRNTLLADGNATGNGGGLFADALATVLLTNVTVANNTAASGAGISHTGTINVANSIFWGNRDEDDAISNFDAAKTTINHSGVEGGVTGGTGNITIQTDNNHTSGNRVNYYYVDFVDADNTTVLDRNYNLNTGSYLINRGNTALVSAAEKDLNGTNRIQHTYVDMGAYESGNKGNLVVTLTIEGDDQTIIYGNSKTVSATVVGGYAGNMTYSMATSNYATLSGTSVLATWAGGTPDVTATFEPTDDAWNTATATLTVTTVQRSISVKAKDETFDYDGATHGYTWDTTIGGMGLVFGDTIDSVTGPQHRNAGTYTDEMLTSATIMNGLVNKSENYSFTYDKGTMIINKADLTVTVDPDQKKNYGTNDPSEYTYTITKGGLKTGDSLTGELSRVAGEDIGEYDILPNTLTLNDGNNGNNYNYVFEKDVFEITPLTITVTRTGVSREYDGTVSVDYTYVVTGGLQGEVFNYTVGTGVFGNKNVGDGKAITITGDKLNGDTIDNYIVIYTDANANVWAKTLTVTGTVDDKTYDGTTVGDYNFVGITPWITGDDVDFDHSTITARFDDKNVGTDKDIIQLTNGILSGTDAGNYIVEYADMTASITAKVLTVTGSVADKVYDSTTAGDYTFVDITPWVAGDDVDFDHSTITARFGDKNVGTDKAIIQLTNGILSGSDAGNYTVEYSDIFADITPKILTVTGTVADKIYDGSTYGDYTYVGITPWITGDDVDFDDSTITAAFGDKNVGKDKSITSGNGVLSGADSGNYSVVYGDITASITPKVLTVTGIVDDKVYDGNTHGDYTFVSITPWLTSDDVDFDHSTITASFVDKNVGNDKDVTSGNGTLSGTDAGNYSVVYGNITADITPKVLTVTGTVADKEYDGNTHGNYTFVDITQWITGDDVDFDDSTITAGFNDKNIGTNKAITQLTNGILSGTDAGNYTVEYADMTADITPKVLTVTGTVADKVYDGSTYGEYTFVDITPWITGDDVDFDHSTITAAFGDKNVGTGKSITSGNGILSGYDAGNYIVEYSDIFASITPRVLTVTGIVDDKVYDGSTHGDYTFVGITPWLTSDDVNFNHATITAEFIDKNVGTDKNVISSNGILSGMDSGNYSVVYGDIFANITPKVLTVTGTVADKVYDGNTHGDYTFVDITPWITGDDVDFDHSGITASFVDKNVGNDKDVTSGNGILSGTDSGNYSVVYSDTTASITPKVLTVTGSVANKEYDGTTHGDYTFVGITPWITGDDVDFDHSTITAAFGDKNVGKDKAINSTKGVLSGSDMGNYSVVYSDIVATITPKDLVVNREGVDREYDGTTNADYVFTGYTGLIDGDNVNYHDGDNASFANKNAGKDKAITINGEWVDGTDLSNYNWSYSDVIATITPKNLVVNREGIDREYDGTTDAEYVFTGFTGLIDGDEVNYHDGKSASFADKNVGKDKAITINGEWVDGSDLSNYDWTYSDVDAGITPKDLIVERTGVNREYDGTTDADYTYKVDGVLDGDKVNYIKDGDSYFANKNVGKDKEILINDSLTGDDLGNYNIIRTDANAEIWAKTLIVDGNVADKVYDGNTDTDYTYGGITPWIDGDDVDFDHTTIDSKFGDKNVGNNKPVSHGGGNLSGEDAGNYIVVYNEIDASITPKDMIVERTGVDREYDGTDNADYTYKPIGVVDGDDINYHKGDAKFEDKNVGKDKPITVNGDYVDGEDRGNYNVIYTDPTATISPKDLIITIDDSTKTVNTPDPKFNGTPDGLQPGDKIDNIDRTDKTENPGKYPIDKVTVDDGNDGKNYNIIVKEGTLTIVEPIIGEARINIYSDASSRRYIVNGQHEASLINRVMGNTANRDADAVLDTETSGHHHGVSHQTVNKSADKLKSNLKETSQKKTFEEIEQALAQRRSNVLVKSSLGDSEKSSILESQYKFDGKGDNVQVRFQGKGGEGKPTAPIHSVAGDSDHPMNNAPSLINIDASGVNVVNFDSVELTDAAWTVKAENCKDKLDILLEELMIV